MALSVSKCRGNLTSSVRQDTRRSVVPARSCVSRKPLAPQAFLKDMTDMVAKGFVGIFSPPKDTMKDWSDTSTNFSGKIRHSSKKPFPDGYQAKYDPKADEAANSEKAAEGEDALSYLKDAAQRVVSNNFTSDSTEPDWEGKGVTGWKGDIHTRDKDGFHSQKH